MINPLKEWPSLFSGTNPCCSENDPVFRLELERLCRIGLSVASAFAVLGPLLGVVAHIALGGVFFFFDGAAGQPLASDLLTILLGLVGLGLSFTSMAGRHGRLIVGVMVVLMFAGATLEETWHAWPSNADPSIGTHFILLMLVCVGTMPYRGRQIALVGVSMSLAYLAAGAFVSMKLGVAEVPNIQIRPGGVDIVFLAMVTLFCTGLSALLYGARSRLILSNKEKEELLGTVTFSEKKYRSLFQDSTDPMFVIDNKTNKFAEVNQAFSDLVNIPTEELYQANFIEFVAPESRDMAIENRRKRAAGEDVDWRYPIKTLRRGSKEPLTCDMTIHQVDDLDYTMGALRDISEIVKAQERASQIAKIPEENPNPVVRISYDGEITYTNPSAKKFLQEYAEPDCSIEKILPDDYLENVRQSIDTGETVMYHQHKTRNRTLAVTYNPHPAERESFVWLMDVTERVEAYDQVKLHVKELENKNKEIQNTRAQLMQADKMAALGNLVAGVAHEINTPLGAINSNVDMNGRALAKLSVLIEQSRKCIPESEFPKIEKYANALVETNKTSHIAVERIVGIVRSLRNFARLDESELKYANLHEGIESTLTLLLHETKHRIEIIKDFGDIPEIQCYPNQLNQVFMNLLVNATQAIEGTGNVTITTRRESDSIVISFKDCGKGIGANEIDQIFDPGFTTKGVGVGTGLGLSIVYRIIQNHDGEITVDSKLGEGSTFKIHLPIR